MRDGRICLHENALGLTILDEVERGVAGVSEYLVHHGCDAAVVDQVVEIGSLEVRYPNRAQLARAVRLFERSPGFEISFEEMTSVAELHPGLWAVDEHEVDVVQTERVEGGIDPPYRLVMGLALGRELGGDEQAVPGNAGEAKSLAHPVLVAIGLGGVDVPVP